MIAPADLVSEAPGYRLDEQVGFVLRQVNQRHAGIFAAAFGDDLTAMQWAALAKLSELGECSQNLLGRLVAMDVATVKGVVDRLAKRGLAETSADPDDRRRIIVRLTEAGRDLYRASAEKALRVTEITLDPLDPKERDTLIRLLRRIR